MKQIKKQSAKISTQLKVVGALIIVCLLLSCLITLNFVGTSKKETPALHHSPGLTAPECDKRGGFYKSALILKLKSTNLRSRIYYTVDGSEPSLESIEYTTPFTIDTYTSVGKKLADIPTSPRWKPPLGEIYRGTILRAIVVDDKNNKSEELIRSFFIDERGNQRYSFPVISLCINEKDFFGYNKGIYVMGKNYGDKNNYIRKNVPLDLPWWEYPSNYLMHGEDAERTAHIEFYEPDGHLGFETNAGIRINGNATRGFAQKSLRVSFGQKYKKEQLVYDLFANKQQLAYNAFILRNSGNDWDKTMFRDAFMQSLMKDTNLDIQDYRPSIVFINGEYWGIHNIRDRFDQYYLANKYHIPADSLTILELNGRVISGNKNNASAFSSLLDFVKHHKLSDSVNYEYVNSKIALESFMDFIIANVYFCNSDWPNNNVKFWRYDGKSDQHPCDGRWRWMLYDTDWGFNYNGLSTPRSDILDKALTEGSTGILFSALLENNTFRKEFLSRFQFHLNNTFYSPSVVEKINQFGTVLEPEIKEHINRWRVIGSYQQWKNNIEGMIDFAKQRPQLQADQLNVFFHLHGSESITVKK
jgi:hypothetical protein